MAHLSENFLELGVIDPSAQKEVLGVKEATFELLLRATSEVL